MVISVLSGIIHNWSHQQLVLSTGHSLKWDRFKFLAKRRSDTHCKIKETMLIKDLEPTLNAYVSSEKLWLY